MPSRKTTEKRTPRKSAGTTAANGAKGTTKSPARKATAKKTSPKKNGTGIPGKDSTGQIAAVAKELLGFASLRPGQEEAIRAILEGIDTLVVQPTGSGKSAIYQIAGHMRQAATAIISPLIALQKDQVDAIERSDLRAAAVVNSKQKASEQRETLERIARGEVQYIYLAPEQLRRPETMERLRSAEIGLFVVDEAHCVSQWGHDFRPDYLQLHHAIEALGHPPVLALTATASPEVRDEIVDRLGLHAPLIFVRGFDRPNISLRVDKFASEGEKRDSLLRRVQFADKPGIIYVATHKNAESLTTELRELGGEASFYHGGLKGSERDEIQDRFMQGDTPVIVATNAFGMGVDKPDIRFVYHFDVSDSLDSYYQEIGRAGRDGEPAEAVLFYRAEDIGAQKFHAGSGTVDTTELETVVEVLSQSSEPVSLDELGEQVDLSQRKLMNTLHRLEEVDAVNQLPEGEVELAEPVPLEDVAASAAELEEQRKEKRRERLARMQEYAETSRCRREALLCYLGDDYHGPCGNCDNCEAAGALR